MAKFQWNKYSAVKTSVYVESVSSTVDSYTELVNVYTVSTSYTFNPQDGTFALKNPTTVSPSNYSYTTHPYMLRDGGVIKVDSFKYGIPCRFEARKLISTLTDGYTKGDLVGVVTSGSPADYPANGIHTDGYWYEYIGEVRGVGCVKYGGVLYDLTGSGYVKINSILCPITSSLMKNNGVLKSLFVGEPVSRLPRGYTELSYIRSSGTQYINTGFKPNNNTRVVVDAKFTSLTANHFMFGARTSSNTVNFGFLYTSSSKKFRVDYGDSSKVDITLSDYLARMKIDKNKQYCYIDDELVATNAVTTFQSAYTLYLFVSNDGGTVKYFGSIDMYSCQIYDDGTLIRDYVPCINPSGEVGLYDLVNETFYTNSGTGTFTAGEAITA